MKTKKSRFKTYLLNVIFLILLFIATLYVIFKDQEIEDVLRYIKLSNNNYLFLGIVMMLLFVCSESVIIHYLMNSLSYNVNLIRCIKYSFIGFFVSAITPSASGGQPAQMYYMNTDGISVSASSLVLMVVTIAYKAVLIILGGFMMITEGNFVMKYVWDVRWVLAFGVLINVAIIGCLLLIIFKQSFAEKVLVSPIIWLGRHRIIKRYSTLADNVHNGIKKYENGADYLRNHKYVLFNVFLITTLQRLFLFYVTYLVYRSFGLTGTSAYQIVTLQTMIALSVDILPLPGGMGASESIFIILFSEIFTAELVVPGMLLSRGITYYALIIFGAVVTAIAQITRNRHLKLTKEVTGELQS